MRLVQANFQEGKGAINPLVQLRVATRQDRSFEQDATDAKGGERKIGTARGTTQTIRLGYWLIGVSYRINAELYSYINLMKYTRT